MHDSVNIRETHRTNNKIFYNVTIVDFERERVGLAYSNREELHKVLRWSTNGNTVPMDICELGNWVYLEEQKEARQDEVQLAILRYKQAQRNRTPEEIEEQRFEARAAMGPGVVMVNVITGERYTT